MIGKIELLSDEELATLIASEKNFTEAEYDHIFSRAKNMVIFYALMNSNNIPEKIFHQIVEGDIQLHKIFIANTNCSPQVLSSLSESSSRSVKENVAANFRTPTKTLDFLGNDAEISIRKNVAANPLTPTKTLLKLIEDENDSVQLNAVKNLHKREDSFMKNWPDEWVIIKYGFTEKYAPTNHKK